MTSKVAALRGLAFPMFSYATGQIFGAVGGRGGP